MKIAETSSGLERQMTVPLIREQDSSRIKASSVTNISENRLKQSLDEHDQDKLLSAVNSVREYVHSMGVKLEFRIHQNSDQVQVTVVNPDNEKIIRKIPPDEILDLAASIEKMLGLFLNKSL